MDHRGQESRACLEQLLALLVLPVSTPERCTEPWGLPPVAAVGLLGEIGRMSMTRSEMALEQLALLRVMYEPYVTPLAAHLLMPLPEWSGEGERAAGRGG